MGLLDDKSWIAHDLYNEYLELKVEISQALHSGIPQEKMSHQIQRLRFVLNQLKVEHGVAMEDLILLNIGIDV